MGERTNTTSRGSRGTYQLAIGSRIEKIGSFQSQGLSYVTKRDALAGYVLEKLMHIGV